MAIHSGFSWIFPLKMVIFHSFLYVYQRVYTHFLAVRMPCFVIYWDLITINGDLLGFTTYLSISMALHHPMALVPAPPRSRRSPRLRWSHFSPGMPGEASCIELRLEVVMLWGIDGETMGETMGNGIFSNFLATRMGIYIYITNMGFFSWD